MKWRDGNKRGFWATKKDVHCEHEGKTLEHFFFKHPDK